ncbi:hypothetical protein JL722_770 [Aureococcus anophagefferens]|nr:hypothetical protein JL722_770 [Aureococcus anophagefferens]
MALKKIQLKRELRKQRRTSIATGAPMPPALPRRLGSVRGADMAGLTKELPRRFTVGSRAQSELRMAGDGSGYYDDDNKDAAKPRPPPPRERESFRRFAGPPKASDAPAPAPKPAAPATPAAPETPAPPSPARRRRAGGPSGDGPRAAARGPRASSRRRSGRRRPSTSTPWAWRRSSTSPARRSGPPRRRRRRRPGFLVDAAGPRATGRRPRGRAGRVAAALARRAVFGALVVTQAREDDAPRAPAPEPEPEADDGDGAVALRDGLLAEVVGDLAPGACAGALLELEAANAKTNAEIALEVSQGHETKELRLEEELKRALHELREERKAAAGLREATDEAAAARDAAVAEAARLAGDRGAVEARAGRATTGSLERANRELEASRATVDDAVEAARRESVDVVADRDRLAAALAAAGAERDAGRALAAAAAEARDKAREAAAKARLSSPPINSEMKLTAHVKIAALLAAAAAETGIVDGPYPIMYGEMFDHDDVALEAAGMDCEAIFAAAPGGSSAYCYMCPVIYGKRNSLYSAIYNGYTCEDSSYYCFEKLTFLLCPETCTGLADNDVVAAYEFSAYGHTTCVGMASEYWSLSVNEQYKMAYACPLSFMYQLSSLGFGDNSTLLESEAARSRPTPTATGYEEAEEAVAACIASNCPEGFDTQYYSYSYEADEDWFDGTCASIEGLLDFSYLCQSADATCDACQSEVRTYAETLWETQAETIGLDCDLDCPAFGVTAVVTGDMTVEGMTLEDAQANEAVFVATVADLADVQEEYVEVAISGARRRLTDTVTSAVEDESDLDAAAALKAGGLVAALAAAAALLA